MYHTYATADLLDSLAAALDAARADAALVRDAQLACRWRNAIEAAADHLLLADALEYDAEAGELIYKSESGQTYYANGACQCKAYAEGIPCKHRAAARLVRRALELEARHMLEACRAEVMGEGVPRCCGGQGCAVCEEIEAAPPAPIVPPPSAAQLGTRLARARAEAERAAQHAAPVVAQPSPAERALAGVLELF